MVSRKVLILLGCALLSLTLLFLKEIHALSISPMMTHVILASLVVEMALAAWWIYKIIANMPII
jgi:hypothetical protein